MFKKTKLCKGLMLAFGGSLALSGLPALAQQAAQLDRVEITGSSIKRVEAEGALQVQTVTKTDIERLGVQTTEQLLQTITAMSSSGQLSGSSGAGLSTYGVSSVSLRGLGDERTLVLLNGRRLAAFAGGGGATVNVNSIPLAAIERVEILKDGASAIYGSDAVAGVVNFILTKNFQGVQLGGTYGTPTTSGGGQQYQANVVAGFGDVTKDKYNLTVSANWSKNELLFAKDREFAKTGNREPYLAATATPQGGISGAWQSGTGSHSTGTRVPGKGISVPNPGDPDFPDLAYRGGSFTAYGNPLAVGDRCGEIRMLTAPPSMVDAFSATGKPFCTFDSAAFVGLTPKTELANYTLNFVYRLNQNAEFFADGIYSRSVVTQQIQPSPLRTSFMATDELFDSVDVDRVLLLRTTNPAYATYAVPYLTANGMAGLVGQDLGITGRVFDFGPRTSEDTSTQSRLVGGLRGDIMGQDYVVAVAQNESKLAGSVIAGYFSQVGFAKATQDPSSDWNPWSSTQSDAFNKAIAPANYVGPTLNATSRSTNFDASLSGSIFKLPAGDLQYAAGYQYRSETYQTNPSAALLEGDIAGLGGASKPIDVSRNITGLFGELIIPVIKNLDLNLAARYDDYSDVGSTNTYKANIRYQPIQSVLLRGSYGTGFRAPTLSDLHDPQVLGTSAIFTDTVTGEAGLQVNEVSGGNPALKPETSKQWSVGFVYQPIASLSIGWDYFNIEIANVISTPSTQELVSQNALGNPAYAGLVVRDPLTNTIVQTKAIPANTGTMQTEGWDLDIRYRQNIGPGRLDAALNSTYYMKFDQSTPGAGTSHKVGTTVDNEGNPVISSNGIDGGVVLRYKQYLSATWTQGAWATTLGNEYAHGYRAGWTQWTGEPTEMPALSLWNLQVAYSGVKNLTLALGARNLLNEQPEIFVPTSNQFQAGYDTTQYDPRGRFVYLNATYKF